MNPMQTIAEADGYRVTQTLTGLIVLIRVDGSSLETDSAYEAIRRVPEPTRARLMEQWRKLQSRRV